MRTLINKETLSEIYTMESKFFNDKSIPKPSKEAFHILTNSSDLKEIESILFHFKQLVNISKSVLTSHTRQNSKITDNREFIENMENRFQKLQDAVSTGKPYQSLFGDVCALKEDLQVILGYYDSQIRQKQPIAKSYLRQAQRKDSKIESLAAGIASQEKSLLDTDESNILAKYTLNFCAADIMQQDMEMICDIVMKPYLADHSNEAGFSYI
ncbi:hypothetical protein [Legionella parisiensis]|uniref:Uncharacterized protein n=1 Tax=Legionella parisiensis TaxID=45071 RepID=A0A1E5JTC1_9GAMM|nr:hypothetical protein [Legionella parisiensis]KTD40593.1 hypothetical protein Lpar_1910 [Legionella parisiensis]OEH47761.1 hypothetical protein lpari_01226 [Legionella parisiensis]STX77014.1 Uncharacterised protein [Legionella parisiensis]